MTTHTSVMERRQVLPRKSNDCGDHDKFSHYVRKDKIVESAVTGSVVVALCGKRWIPNSDPKRFPVCPECKEIYGRLSS